MNGPNLPLPDALGSTHSQQLQQLIQQEIVQQGRISFARFMELALYAPGLGYYSAGAHKFGAGGDFITAPEISPLFGACLAKQCAEIFSEIGTRAILEFGAGSGKMAADILLSLEQIQQLPECYYILEVSADLKERQQKYLQQQIPELYPLIQWLEELPAEFSGVIIANEVLDAMPISKFSITPAGELKEFFVTVKNNTFEWQLDKVTTPGLAEAVRSLDIKSEYEYVSEINLELPAWLKSLSIMLQQGIILLLDYGFPQREYYHPQRNMGTLMCHYRHHAHTDPFFMPGLQDITAHVDFTAVAEIANACGLTVQGYTNQAGFLLGCGIMQILEFDKLTPEQQWQHSQAIKKLTLPSEMGELFKVIALAKNIDMPLLGFSLLDMKERLC